MVTAKGFLTVLMFVLFANLASASFSIGNVSHSLEDVYGPSSDIEGWVNISITDEDTNSLFSDANGNSIEVLKLLNKSDNGNYSYSCNPLDCSTDYVASNPESMKTFDLELGNSILYGLRFTGNVITVNSVDFELGSNAPVSCTSQIEVDILADGEVDYLNDKVAAGPGCSQLKSYGCFDSGTSTEEFIISTVPYCQRIELSESPGFEVGAWVKKVSGNQSLRVSVYDGNGAENANCALPEVTGEGEFSCSVDYAVTEAADHFVCVYSIGGTGDYRIRGYSDSINGCGFFGIPLPSTTPATYEIFAEGKSFDAPGTLQIQNSFPNGNTFGSIVNEYITNTYGGFDCTSECVVPIRFTSGVNQQITLNNLSANYEKASGVVTEANFFDLTETPAKINSGFGRLFLDDGGFSVPSTKGDYTFDLKLNDIQVLSEKVSVEDVPKIISLKPGSTASAFPTEFKLGVSSKRNISKYFWDFGDGSVPDVTTTNKATHTYSKVGEYSLKVTVTDVEDFSSTKTFNMSVNSPKNLINTTLKTTRENIDNIRARISSFDFFTQNSIDSVLGIDSAETEISRLTSEFNAATTDEEYNLIITDLLKISIPKSVLESSTANSITFFPDRENIELDVIGGITGETFDSGNRDGYVNGVILWNQENLDVKLDFREISGEFENFVEPVVNIFEAEIRERKDIGYNYFLVMPKLDNLEFESGVVSREEGGFVYVDLSGISRGKVSFSTTEDVDFIDLPAFVSPGFSRLTVSEVGSGTGTSEEEDSRFTIFILAILLLVVAAFIVYVILQSWYKKKYEDYLFKNKNDLYNIVNYVNNAKKRGLNRKEISAHLRKAKWSSEQIRYVMRKYAGKKTGMLELPITKTIGKMNKRDGSK